MKNEDFQKEVLEQLKSLKEHQIILTGNISEVKDSQVTVTKN